MLIKLVDDEGREEASGAGGRLKHTECPWRAQEEEGAECRRERKRERSPLQRARQNLDSRRTGPSSQPFCTMIQEEGSMAVHGNVQKRRAVRGEMRTLAAGCDGP